MSHTARQVRILRLAVRRYRHLGTVFPTEFSIHGYYTDLPGHFETLPFTKEDLEPVPGRFQFTYWRDPLIVVIRLLNKLPRID